MTGSVRAALGLALVPFVGLGLARFAYGLLLPPMRDDLDWSYGAAGGATTANAVGYLAGAMLAPLAMRFFGDRRAVIGSIWATAAMLAINGLTGNYEIILLARFGAGLTSGIAFVIGGVMAAGLSRRGAPEALTWYPAGAGAGIAVSAIGIPVLIEPASRWPIGWYVLAAMTIGCAVALSFLLPASTDAGSVAAPQASNEDGHEGSPSLWRTEAAYGLFGLGYIAYITFVVAYLRDGGASSQMIIGFWFLLGMAAVVSTQIWPRLLRSRAGHSGLAGTLAGCALAVLLIALSRHWASAAVSAALFGSCLLAVVSAVTGIARDLVPEHSWPAAIARLTVIFGIGQTLGPILAGFLGDTAAGLRLGLVFSALLLVAGTIVAATGRRVVDTVQPSTR